MVNHLSSLLYRLPEVSELSSWRYGLSPTDPVSPLGLVSVGEDQLNVEQLTQLLVHTYCGSTALECDYLQVRGGKYQ